MQKNAGNTEILCVQIFLQNNLLDIAGNSGLGGCNSFAYSFYKLLTLRALFVMIAQSTKPERILH